jgi:hypothetical protein
LMCFFFQCSFVDMPAEHFTHVNYVRPTTQANKDDVACIVFLAPHCFRYDSEIRIPVLSIVPRGVDCSSYMSVSIVKFHIFSLCIYFCGVCREKAGLCTIARSFQLHIDYISSTFLNTGIVSSIISFCPCP